MPIDDSVNKFFNLFCPKNIPIDNSSTYFAKNMQKDDL